MPDSTFLPVFSPIRTNFPAQEARRAPRIAWGYLQGPRDWQRSPCSAGGDPDADCGGSWPAAAAGDGRCGACRLVKRRPETDALPLAQFPFLSRFGIFATLAWVVYTGLYKPTLTHFIACLCRQAFRWTIPWTFPRVSAYKGLNDERGRRPAQTKGSLQGFAVLVYAKIEGGAVVDSSC